MRNNPVYLFDIDGTLLTKAISGPTIKQQAFARVMEEVCGIPDVDYMQFPIHGATDPGIPRLVLRHYGWTEAAIEGVMTEFFERYMEYFEELDTGERVSEYVVLPGVLGFLDRVKDGVLGLATGNMERFAWYKLRAVGIDGYFSFGGFGDDGVEREGIVEAAVRKAGVADASEAIVFGDTPRDIEAAQAVGCRVCAVATGHFGVSELLLYCRPCDRVIPDFGSIREDDLR